MKPFSLINKLNSSKDFNKDLALKFDAGKVSSEKYGEAILAGQLLLVKPHGEYPEVYLKQIEEKAHTWLCEMMMEEHEYDLFEKVKLQEMVAHTAAGIDPEKLGLYFKTIVLGFSFDDIVFKQNHLTENNPTKLQEDLPKLVENLISIIDNHGAANSAEAAASKLHPMFKSFCYGLAHVCEKSFEQMNRVDYARFARELMEFIRVNKWIQEYRLVPYSKDEYFFIRYFDVGMSMGLYALCFSADIRISDEIRMHPLFQKYYKNVLIHIGLSNDLLSVKKEMSGNDTGQSLVFLKCQKYSLQKSIDKIEKACNELIIDLKKDAVKLKSYFPTDESLKKFIHVAECCVDGCLYWYQQSRRYGDIKYEIYVVDHDSDYNNWFEKMGIFDVANMKEAVLSKLSKNDDRMAYPSFFT